MCEVRSRGLVLLYLSTFTNKLVLRQFLTRDPHVKTLHERDLTVKKRSYANHFGKFDFRIAQLFTIP